MFGLVSTLISTSFKATVLVSGAIIGFTYLTKPTDSSFSTYVSQQAPLGTQTVVKGIAYGATNIDDYVCFKLVKLSGSNEPAYIGVANHWIPLK